MPRQETGGLDHSSAKDSHKGHNQRFGGIHQGREDMGQPGSEQAREEPKNRAARYRAIEQAAINQRQDVLAQFDAAEAAREKGLPSPTKEQILAARRGGAATAPAPVPAPTPNGKKTKKLTKEKHA